MGIGSRISRQSDEWIMGLPRTKRLGSFAGDGSMVGSAHALWMAMWILRDSVTEEDIEDLRRELDGEVLRVRFENLKGTKSQEHLVENVFSEGVAWMKHTNHPDTTLMLSRAPIDPVMTARIELICSILDMPENALAYFEAGILDPETVWRCLDEGIDVSLASELAVGV